MINHALDKPTYPVKRRKRVDIGAIVAFVVLVLLSIVMLLPVFFMVSTALKSDSEMLVFPPTWIPHPFVWSNFTRLFKELAFATYFKNSIIYAVFAVLGELISSSLVAYGFARFRAKGKNVLFMILLSTMMLPYPAVMIPQFLLFKKLGWVDTLLPLIVPTYFGSAYLIFLLRQFFTTLPEELFEAARLDGCSEFRMFWQIALPLSGAALATAAIFSFVYHWNNLLAPVIYLSSDSSYTLPIGMASMRSLYRIVPWNLLMVASIYAVLPIVLLFFFFQRYFVEGIVLTGSKG